MFFYSETLTSEQVENIITAWREQQILSGSLAGTNDYFGGIVSVGVGGMFGNHTIDINADGTRMIVGAPYDERPAGADGSGVAYVFSSGSSGWQQEHILSGTQAIHSIDFFGSSVAINAVGNIVVVGASYDERPSGNDRSGLAYVFVSNSSGWSQQQILSGTLASQADDYFGVCVDINNDGNRIAVGAHDAGSSNNHGVVFIFDSGSTGWAQVSALTGTSPGTTSADDFGACVAFNGSGQRIFIGDYYDEFGGPINLGGVYVFTSGSSGWIREKILSGSLASATGDEFGKSVASNTNGDKIVVGARFDERTGTNGEGLAYVFSSGSSGWVQEHILSGSFATNNIDQFGYSVSMNGTGEYIVVGAPGDERSGGSDGSGLAYVFVSSSGGWIEKQILSGTFATGSNEYYGMSVIINSSGNCIAVSAPGDESGSLSNSGLVYVYDGV